MRSSTKAPKDQATPNTILKKRRRVRGLLFCKFVGDATVKRSTSEAHNEGALKLIVAQFWQHRYTDIQKINRSEEARTAQSHTRTRTAQS